MLTAMAHSAPGKNVPLPPALHWTIVLLLGIATIGIFLDVWSIVQAIWVRKFDHSSRALGIYIVALALSIVGAILGTLKAPHSIEYPVDIAALLLVVVASFSVRDSLGAYITQIEGRPTYLSGVMTIFFGPIYLQYHMNGVRSYQHRQLATAHAR